MKVKILPPTLRERSRYLVFHVISKSKFEGEEIKKAINYTAMSFLGRYGFSSLKCRLIEWDFEEQKGIIKFMYKKKNELKSVLVLVNNINSNDLIIHTLGISGTIKKARGKW